MKELTVLDGSRREEVDGERFNFILGIAAEKKDKTRGRRIGRLVESMGRGGCVVLLLLRC